jgi:hypothetical protein
MEMIFGIVAFVVLFATWVIVPSIIKKRHAARAGEKSMEFSNR